MHMSDPVPASRREAGGGDEDGIWSQVFAPPAAPTSRPALFLDRDGVIVEDVGHLHRVADIRLIAGAAQVIACANQRSVPAVIVTNQSGLGRGLFRWDEFVAVQGEILRRLAAAGARVDAVFACPFHPAARPPYRHPDHPARKPNPGMLLTAARRLGLDLRASWIVGDRARDLAAGRTAGLAGGMLVGAGRGDDAVEQTAALALAAAPHFQVLIGAGVADACALPLLAGPPP